MTENAVLSTLRCTPLQNFPTEADTAGLMHSTFYSVLPLGRLSDVLIKHFMTSTDFEFAMKFRSVSHLVQGAQYFSFSSVRHLFTAMGRTTSSQTFVFLSRSLASIYFKHNIHKNINSGVPENG